MIRVTILKKNYIFPKLSFISFFGRLRKTKCSQLLQVLSAIRFMLHVFEKAN
jgi:hypothetical protein